MFCLCLLWCDLVLIWFYCILHVIIWVLSFLIVSSFYLTQSYCSLSVILVVFLGSCSILLYSIKICLLNLCLNCLELVYLYCIQVSWFIESSFLVCFSFCFKIWSFEVTCLLYIVVTCFILFHLILFVYHFWLMCQLLFLIF